MFRRTLLEVAVEEVNDPLPVLVGGGGALAVPCPGISHSSLGSPAAAKMASLSAGEMVSSSRPCITNSGGGERSETVRSGTISLVPMPVLRSASHTVMGAKGNAGQPMK